MMQSSRMVAVVLTIALAATFAFAAPRRTARPRIDVSLPPSDAPPAPIGSRGYWVTLHPGMWWWSGPLLTQPTGVRYVGGDENVTADATGASSPQGDGPVRIQYGWRRIDTIVGTRPSNWHRTPSGAIPITYGTSTGQVWQVRFRATNDFYRDSPWTEAPPIRLGPDRLHDDDETRKEP